jgi:hypothetical protein
MSTTSLAIWMRALCLTDIMVVFAVTIKQLALHAYLTRPW